MSSVLTNSQTRVYRKDYGYCNPEILIATARYDDLCGNGHNTFSLTGDLYDRSRGRSSDWLLHNNGTKIYIGAGGCLHTEIKRHFPELAPFIKWHLCSSDGPLHYIANTIYHVGQGDIDSAKVSAIWPDAPDYAFENADILEDLLRWRLPALLADFRSAMESLGFVF